MLNFRIFLSFGKVRGGQGPGCANFDLTQEAISSLFVGTPYRGGSATRENQYRYLPGASLKQTDHARQRMSSKSPIYGYIWKMLCAMKSLWIFFFLGARTLLSEDILHTSTISIAQRTPATDNSFEILPRFIFKSKRQLFQFQSWSIIYPGLARNFRSWGKLALISTLRCLAQSRIRVTSSFSRLFSDEFLASFAYLFQSTTFWGIGNS